MICTDAERDALMAAVEEYGEARASQVEAWETSSSAVADHYGKNADKEMYAIRAMLAPPDDAVLGDRIAKAIKSVEHKELADRGYVDAIADAIITVLRGEATR